MLDQEESRFRRDRAVVMVLLAVLLGGILIYIAAVSSAAREWRTRTVLGLHENTARLCANLLDEECDNALDVLRSLARPTALDTAPPTGKPVVLSPRYLHEAVELVPNLMATALYDGQGKRIAVYPANAPFPRSAQKQHWFDQVVRSRRATVGDVVRLPDANGTQVFTLAVPVEGTRGGGGEYLVAYYRIGNTYQWLRDVRISGGAVFLADTTGRVVLASSAHAVVPPPLLKENPILQRALTGQSGAKLLSYANPINTRATTASVVGYAFASEPRLVVYVVQPESAAFAPNDFLVRRLLWVAILLLILIPVSGWNLVNLYQRARRLAKRLAAQNEQLVLVSEAKSELLANVSHDLKTPIASMQLSLSGVMEPQMAAAVPSPVAECLTLLQQELGQLSARVRNLLDMSRLEVQETADYREPCDLTDIAADALERIRVQLAGRPLHATFPAEPLLVECDQVQMQTVILNLLENAAKYSAPDSPLYLSGTREANSVVFRLRDTGPGIPMPQREQVFQKFYRFGTPYSSGGTGLGLAICRTIVEAHGGTIAIQEEDGASSGTTFVVRLPAATEETTNNDG